MKTRAFILAVVALGGWALSVATEPYAPTATLKEAFADDFLIGAALNEDQVRGKPPEALELVEQQYNSITPENLLKWENVHPKPGKYDFEAADKFVEFGEQHGMFIVGHTLVWHSQTPRWVFEDDQGQPLDRDALLERMRDHIHTVVGRYKGRIRGWDVVNEAIEVDRRDDRKGSWRETPWRRIIGPDYIVKAFQYAHEADPNAELYYNDYDAWKIGKRRFFEEIVRNIRSQGLRIDGIGLQGHWGLDYPTVTELEFMFRDLSKLGVKLMITELDVNVLPNPIQGLGANVNLRVGERPEFNPYPDGLPRRAQNELTRRYELLFNIFHDHRRNIARVTFWGLNDGQSWLNNWPVPGRTNYPLLFDRNYHPKPAFDAVLRVTNDGQRQD
jgi:endo-1,4-beta-xylanase